MSEHVVARDKTGENGVMGESVRLSLWYLTPNQVMPRLNGSLTGTSAKKMLDQWAYFGT